MVSWDISRAWSHSWNTEKSFPSAFSYLLPGNSFLSSIVLEERWSGEDGVEKREAIIILSAPCNLVSLLFSFLSFLPLPSQASDPKLVVLVYSSSRDNVCLWQKQTLSARGGDMTQEHTAHSVCTTFSLILPVNARKTALSLQRKAKKKKKVKWLQFDFTGGPSWL